MIVIKVVCPGETFPRGILERTMEGYTDVLFMTIDVDGNRFTHFYAIAPPGRSAFTLDDFLILGTDETVGAGVKKCGPKARLLSYRPVRCPVHLREAADTIRKAGGGCAN